MVRAALLIACLFAALLAGCAAPPDRSDVESPPTSVPPEPALLAEDCPGHGHLGLSVVVAGRPLTFAGEGQEHHGDPAVEPAGVFYSDRVVHFQQDPERCTPLEDVLRKLGVTVADNRGIILSGDHGDRAGSYPPSDTHRTEFWAGPAGGSWAQVEDVEPFLQGQPADGLQTLVTYIDPGREDRTAQLEAVPPADADARHG